MDSFQCKLPSWDDIHETAESTAVKLKEDKFNPDIIIAIARGGLVPARLFCDFLHVKNCLSIKVDHWGLTATKDGKAKLTHALNLSLENKKVLLVDDITDTGQSMELAKDHLLTLNPQEVRTATLYHLSGSKYVPDYYGEEMDWAWIIFPWNYTEDMVNIIRKITETEEPVISVIKEKLKTNFNLSLNENKIKDILNHITYLDSLGK